MINGTELLNFKMDASTDSYVSAYRMVVEILANQYKIDSNRYFLEFIDYTDNFIFYTYKFVKELKFLFR